MKKFLYLFIALAILAGFYVWFRGEDKVVVAFGDSLTYGVGSTQGGGFVTDLSNELGVPIVNLGVSGDTTAKAFKRIEQVLDKKPDVILLLLGGNDYLQNVPKEETRKNLEAIIETLQKSGSK